MDVSLLLFSYCAERRKIALTLNMFLAILGSMNQKACIKLALAAHRVADLLPEDPITQEIEDMVDGILANLILFCEKEAVSLEKKKTIGLQIQREIDILQVYFRRARREGWVDPRNFFALEKEYEKIQEIILMFEDAWESLCHETNKSILIKQSAAHDNPGSSRLVLQTEETKKEREASFPGAEPFEKSYVKISGATLPTAQEEMLHQGVTEGVPNGVSDRQRKILEMLKRKEKVQVWELQKILPQVTKRTLRRDMDDLLQKNLVERRGSWNEVFYQLK